MSTLAPQQPGIELKVPAIAENVAVVRHAFGGFGDALDLPEQLVSDIKLAVTEACTNVVVHAYPDGHDGLIEITAHVHDDVLTIIVADHGNGLLPRLDSPGLGLGLPLIATLATSLELDTESDERTLVRITFDLTATDA
ncbi:MAG TPA: ATP-binding protein [Baekduia sp.]|nr:ATP-binding protein [Baekduia sp.]